MKRKLFTMYCTLNSIRMIWKSEFKLWRPLEWTKKSFIQKCTQFGLAVVLFLFPLFSRYTIQTLWISSHSLYGIVSQRSFCCYFGYDNNFLASFSAPVFSGANLAYFAYLVSNYTIFFYHFVFLIYLHAFFIILIITCMSSFLSKWMIASHTEKNRKN